jgi:Protein of unknown function (DUF1353)
VKEFAYRLDHDRVEIAGSRLPPPVITSPSIGRWRLEVAYTYHDGATAITVPAGFEFDLSSVPRVLWPLIAPFELSIVAPLLHDFLYRYGGRPPSGSVVPPKSYDRAEVDRMFRTIMEAENVSVWRRVLAYAAVRVLGRGAWRG